MRTLLCLLSDQHVPNLLAIHHYRPDHLVLVESTQMHTRKLAEHFLRALQLGGLDYVSRHHVVPLDAEDSLPAIRRALQSAYSKYAGADWIVNMTGGTKPMSIATYEFFKALGGKLVYTNVVRPARLIDMSTNETEDSSHRLCIKEFLAGYGFESKKPDSRLNEAEARAMDWVGSANLLAANASENNVLNVTEEERQQARAKGIELPAERFLFPCDNLRKLWLNGAANRKLSKHEGQFLTGGWLEVFVWNLLKTHANALGIWDVRLGVEVARHGAAAGNDFDVAFMHDYGLCMVECKTGAQENDPRSDVLYKVEAVTRQFRALRVRSYLATTATNVLDRENKVKEQIRTRAEIYQCQILTLNEIRTLGANKADTEIVRQVFFGGIHHN